MPRAGQRTCQWQKRRCIPQEPPSWRCKIQAVTLLGRSVKLCLEEAWSFRSKKLHGSNRYPQYICRVKATWLYLAVKSSICTDSSSTTDNRVSTHVGFRMSEGKLYQVKSGGTAQPPRAKEAPKWHSMEPGVGDHLGTGCQIES
jgi:hypothetical protein